MELPQSAFLIRFGQKFDRIGARSSLVHDEHYAFPERPAEPPQHFLYFLPLPQGQGALRRISPLWAILP